MSTDCSPSPVSSSSSPSPRIAVLPATEDGDEYSNSELQFILDTVIRAEAVLPTLPTTSRLPTNALFRAFNQICDERDVDPVNGLKLDKLLFKIGGSRHGKTIIEKFQAVMARMNITVRLDGDEDDASDDSFSHRSHPSENADDTLDLLINPVSPVFSQREPSPPGYPRSPSPPSRRAESQPHHNRPAPLPHHHIESRPPSYHESESLPSSDYGHGSQPLPSRQIEPRPAPFHRAESRLSQPSYPSQDAAKDAALQKVAAAYQKHRDKISSMDALHKWQEKSSALKNRTQLFEDAQKQDFKDAACNVIVAWNEIANEVDEMPLAELPSNVYSKRIEKIAIRTDEIKTTKKAIDSWNYRAMSQEEEDDLFKEDPRLARVAQSTHEIISKSRVITHWANRAEEENEKARLAKAAHEMTLKRKVFGLGRPNWANLKAALERRQDAAQQQLPPTAQPQSIGEQQPQEATGQPAPTIEQSREPVERAQYTATRPLEPARSPSPVTRQPQQSPENRGVVAKESVPATGQPAPTTQRAQAPTEQSTGRALETNQRPPEVSEQSRNPTKPLQPVHKTRKEKLLDALDDEPDERTLLARRHLMRMKFFSAWEAHTQEYASKVKAAVTSKALDPWRQRASDIDRAHKHDDITTKNKRRLSQWQQSDRPKKLEEKATQFHAQTRVGSALEGWKAAVQEAKGQEQQRQHMAERGDEYRRKHGTLQTWKARARETAVQTSMKVEALETWRDECGEDQARNEELDHMAHRVSLYRIKTKTMPSWREATAKAVAKQEQLQTFAQRAEFYTCTTSVLSGWRAAAEERRKAKLKQAYLENRRRVKKNMGARAIDQWHATSEIRYEQMEIAIEEFTADRDWAATAKAWVGWRRRAKEHANAEAARQAEAEQKRLDEWRVQAEGRRQSQAETEELFEDIALSGRIKQWKIGSLQLETRRDAAQKHLNRERKLMRQGLETWMAKAQKKRAVGPPETPGRPRLLFGTGASTTPLAPPPSRAFGRSKRNLRVSWAQ
ncbi:hypothetical protein BKA67DRAFT_654766 [Truncatella angustata]|uniref:Sfi1 spindle body domain-containing protein n=1 Tax=Truncatella angustata TaxID=152316 RepID=A0A9P8UQC4_9PEZI|nr:uncharacterized protein BKA67DRAFT_654766 [Truncatella angustata]KAH6656429.1 hypothetical protein BKA67DRAFT_654766 [Truncatella angustata]